MNLIIQKLSSKLIDVLQIFSGQPFYPSGASAAPHLLQDQVLDVNYYYVAPAFLNMGHGRRLQVAVTNKI